MGGKGGCLTKDTTYKTCVEAILMQHICILDRSLILGQLKTMGFIRQRGSSDMRDLNTNSGNWAIVKVGQNVSLSPIATASLLAFSAVNDNISFVSRLLCTLDFTLILCTLTRRPRNLPLSKYNC